MEQLLTVFGFMVIFFIALFRAMLSYLNRETIVELVLYSGLTMYFAYLTGHFIKLIATS